MESHSSSKPRICIQSAKFSSVEIHPTEWFTPTVDLSAAGASAESLLIKDSVVEDKIDGFAMIEHPSAEEQAMPTSDPAAAVTSDPAAAVTSDPAASDPAASDPAASDPAASDPAASDPAAAVASDLAAAVASDPAAAVASAKRLSRKATFVIQHYTHPAKSPESSNKTQEFPIDNRPIYIGFPESTPEVFSNRDKLRFLALEILTQSYCKGTCGKGNCQGRWC